jgi:nitroreductase/NAD-dependent dihydropyrimidine dehydrogenase PreA subunit
MIPDFTIDEKACTKCGKCIRECGHHENSRKLPRVDLDNPDCSRCYHCYTICPSNAIRFSDERAVPAFSKDLMKGITNDNLLNFLAFRRSIRSFQQKTVDDALVEKLINGARFIPSGGNAHSYEFTVLKGDLVATVSLKNELCNVYKKRSRLLNNILLRNIAKPFVNSLARGFLRDKGYRIRIKKLVERLDTGEDVFFRDAPVIVILHSKAVIPTPKEDCILAGYNITMLAQSNGLGSCFVTLAQNAVNASVKCKKIIGLSRNDHIYAVVFLGYPAVMHLRSAPKREKTIHWL